MAVNENVGTYSTTAASNTPAGTDNVGPDLDNHLRDIKKNIRVTAENAKGPSSPASSFTGRFWVDTARSASTSLTLKLHDYEGFVSVFDMDTSANAMTSANFANSAIALTQIDFDSGLNASAIPLSAIDFQSDLTASAISRTFIDIADSSIPRNSLSLVGQIDTTDLSASAVTSAKIDSGAVTTGKIADDAVTLAKLAAGTDGELITWDAAGDPTTVAVGTSGHVLTSNGAGAAPTFQANAAIFTESYASSLQAISAGGQLTLAHGLSGVPWVVHTELEAQAAVEGYVTGDVVMVANTGEDAAQNRGLSVKLDSTNITVRFGSSANSLNLINASDGTIFAITNSQWQLRVRAFA